LCEHINTSCRKLDRLRAMQKVWGNMERGAKLLRMKRLVQKASRGVGTHHLLMPIN
jgi:hypothetical protein